MQQQPETRTTKNPMARPEVELIQARVHSPGAADALICSMGGTQKWTQKYNKFVICILTFHYVKISLGKVFEWFTVIDNLNVRQYKTIIIPYIIHFQ